MKKPGLIILLAIGLLSCNEKRLEITEIEGIPPNVTGCSCIFAKSKEEFEKKKFIFINTGQISILSIKNELVSWNPYGSDDAPFQVITTYSSENQIDQELKELEGKIIITSNDGSTITLPVYGQCGC